MQNHKKNVGFSLIELMITLAIIGILAAVALPAYDSYVTRGRIPDATSYLAAQRVRMEQYYQDNRTYVGFPLCTTADTSSSPHFNFSCDGAPTASTFTLQAVGKAAMAGFTFKVDQQNSKSSTVTGVSGWSGNAACWVTNKGGKC